MKQRSSWRRAIDDVSFSLAFRRFREAEGKVAIEDLLDMEFLSEVKDVMEEIRRAYVC